MESMSKKRKGMKTKFSPEHKLFVAELVFLCPQYSSAKIATKFKEKFPGMTIYSQRVRDIERILV